MRDYVKLSLFFIGMAMFPAFAVYWEVQVSKLVIWWWTEMFSTRHLMSEKEAVITFLGVAFATITIIPHMYWAPVHAFKELNYLFKEAQLALYGTRTV